MSTLAHIYFLQPQSCWAQPVTRPAVILSVWLKNKGQFLAKPLVQPKTLSDRFDSLAHGACSLNRGRVTVLFLHLAQLRCLTWDIHMMTDTRGQDSSTLKIVFICNGGWKRFIRAFRAENSLNHIQWGPSREAHGNHYSKTSLSHIFPNIFDFYHFYYTLHSEMSLNVFLNATETAGKKNTNSMRPIVSKAHSHQYIDEPSNIPQVTTPWECIRRPSHRSWWRETAEKWHCAHPSPRIKSSDYHEDMRWPYPTEKAARRIHLCIRCLFYYLKC